MYRIICTRRVHPTTYTDQWPAEISFYKDDKTYNDIIVERRVPDLIIYKPMRLCQKKKKSLSLIPRYLFEDLKM